MLMKHINEPPPPIKGISSDMQAVLDRALAKDPTLRYESAGEMANEFFAIFNGQTVSPGTLHKAQMARMVNEEKKAPEKNQQASNRFRWARVAVEAIAALLLIFALYQYIKPMMTATVSATAVPRDPNIPAGRLKFGDFSSIMDEVTLSLNNADPPAEGYQYEAWLTNEDKATIHKLGIITFNTAGIGSLELIDPEQQNLFKENNQLIISAEVTGTENAEPTGEIVYSSVYPPEVLTPARNLLTEYESTPDNLALIQGLWYYSGSYINISINGYTEDPNQETVGLVDAYKNGDESTVRKRTEEIINQIVGASSDIYLDYDGDGKIDDTTDGYGSFQNGDSPGYVQESALQVKLAVDTIDSTPNIRTNGADFQVCIQNMEERLNQILQLALLLKDMPFDTEMGPIITELETLGDFLVRGVDANQNGLIEPLAGECGANSAYEFSYNMADMLIYPGADRIPPSGK
jgi:anti-sigma-K factor RskA